MESCFSGDPSILGATTSGTDPLKSKGPGPGWASSASHRESFFNVYVFNSISTKPDWGGVCKRFFAEFCKCGQFFSTNRTYSLTIFNNTICALSSMIHLCSMLWFVAWRCLSLLSAFFGCVGAILGAAWGSPPANMAPQWR